MENDVYVASVPFLFFQNSDLNAGFRPTSAPEVAGKVLAITI